MHNQLSNLKSTLPSVAKSSSEAIKGEIVITSQKNIRTPGPVIYSKKLQNQDQGYVILCRLIKRVTQQIGEYRRSGNPYAVKYLIPALREARSNMVTDLEVNYGISWEINPETGESVFYC